MTPLKVLVTGGCGFIGSNLAAELLRRGHSVRIIDNISTGRRKNISSFEKDIELIEGDIRSYHLVSQAVRDIDIIFHQAALPSVPRSINDPITSNEVNIGGTLNILEAARDEGVEKVVYASSSSVYGDNPQLPKNEEMITNPLSPYAVSKLAGEKYCRVFSDLFDLHTVALRYFNVFGPRQDPESQYSAVIPKFVTAMINGTQPTIYGDGEQSRDFTFVANVVESNMLAVTAVEDSGKVFNCATHGQVTLNELVQSISKIIGQNITPLYEDARPGDIKHSYADIDRFHEASGYKPIISFEEGLRITIKHFMES